MNMCVHVIEVGILGGEIDSIAEKTLVWFILELRKREVRLREARSGRDVITLGSRAHVCKLNAGTIEDPNLMDNHTDWD
jgi:hypothetical protein